MSRPGPTPIELLVLADGRTMREAAGIARVPSAQAVREARDVGWPDLDAVRLAAEEIRERHPAPTDDLPGGDPVPPRKTREPIPVEPDVEDAITRGARQAETSRQALATSSKARDARADELLAERTAATEAEASVAIDEDPDGAHTRKIGTATEVGQPQPAAEATDDEAPCVMAQDHVTRDYGPELEVGMRWADGGVIGTLMPCNGCDVGLVLDPDDLQPGPPPPGVEPDIAALRAEAQAGLTAAEQSRAARMLKGDASMCRLVHELDTPIVIAPAERVSDDRTDLSRVLDLVERLGGAGIAPAAGTRSLGALTVEQRQRAVALREARDILSAPDPTPGDLLALADYITTGTVPALVVRGLLGAGGEGR